MILLRTVCYLNSSKPTDEDFLGMVVFHYFDVSLCLVEVEKVEYEFFSVSGDAFVKGFECLAADYSVNNYIRVKAAVFVEEV